MLVAVGADRGGRIARAHQRLDRLVVHAIGPGLGGEGLLPGLEACTRIATVAAMAGAWNSARVTRVPRSAFRIQTSKLKPPAAVSATGRCSCHQVVNERLLMFRSPTLIRPSATFSRKREKARAFSPSPLGGEGPQSGGEGASMPRGTLFRNDGGADVFPDQPSFHASDAPVS